MVHLLQWFLVIEERKRRIIIVVVPLFYPLLCIILKKNGTQISIAYFYRLHQQSIFLINETTGDDLKPVSSSIICECSGCGTSLIQNLVKLFPLYSVHPEQRKYGNPNDPFISTRSTERIKSNKIIPNYFIVFFC